MMYLRRIQGRLIKNYRVLPNYTTSHVSKSFSSQNNDATKNVLNDLEKGGTFDSRKRVPKIISNELRDKIKDHVSSSSGSGSDYQFSSARNKTMVQNSTNAKGNSFSTSYNGAMSGPKNETENLMNAFQSDIQEDPKLKSSFASKKASLSQFTKKTTKKLGRPKLSNNVTTRADDNEAGMGYHLIFRHLRD